MKTKVKLFITPFGLLAGLIVLLPFYQNCSQSRFSPLLSGSPANTSASTESPATLVPLVIQAGTFPLTDSQYQHILVTAAAAAHPRLLSGASPNALATFINTSVNQIPQNPNTKIPSYYAQVKAYADTVINLPPTADPRPAGQFVDMIWTVREAGERILALGTMWKLTGNPAYLNAGLANLNAILAFRDWDTVQASTPADPLFLNTAELTYASAVGFDFFHDQLSASEKASIVSTIISKGLSYYAQLNDPNPAYWSRGPGNWNMVCNSAGLAAILAIEGDIPTSQQSMIQSIALEALLSLKKGISEFGADGGYPEGGLYWGYANRYLTMMMNSYLGATGSDFGIGALPAIASTPYFLASLVPSPASITASACKATANYGDTDAFVGNQSALFAYAYRYSDPFLLNIAQNIVDSAPNSSGLMIDEGCVRNPYFPRVVPNFGTASFLLEAQAEQANINQVPIQVKSQLDWVFGGPTGTASLRASWTDPASAWVTFKAGNVSGTHNKLDLGAFTYVSNGISWVTEPGKDDYNLAGYFSVGNDGERWSYYRNSTLGQSSMAFCSGENCPDANNLDQGSSVGFCGFSACVSPFAADFSSLAITPFNHIPSFVASFGLLESSASQASLSIDLSGATSATPTWTRQFTLAPDAQGVARNALVVNDQFSGSGINCQYIWSVQTNENTAVATDGQSVTLTDTSGKTAVISLLQELPSVTGRFNAQAVHLDGYQVATKTLQRVTYTGSCKALTGGALHTVSIEIK